MTIEELITWAQQVFGDVLADDTDRAITDLNQLTSNEAWWVAEKAERLMMLAKTVVEEKE